MKNLLIGAGGLALSAAFVGVAVAGPDWVEAGDAGSSILTAQVPVSPALNITTIRTISGTLTGSARGEPGNPQAPDFEDLYFFKVTQVGEFSIRPISANFDAVLYLFNLSVNFEGFGLLANDNENSDSVIPQILPFATDGTGVQISVPGDYVLAVASKGRVPVSRTGPIFNFQTPTEISGPDGPGGLNPLSGWTGPGIAGDYSLQLEESGFPTVPAPGAALLTIAGAVLAAGRRRQA